MYAGIAKKVVGMVLFSMYSTILPVSLICAAEPSERSSIVRMNAFAVLFGVCFMVIPGVICWVIKAVGDAGLFRAEKRSNDKMSVVKNNVCFLVMCDNPCCLSEGSFDGW